MLNPTITGGTWNTHFNNTVQYNTSISSFTGGTEISGGYFTSSTSLDLGNATDFNFQLGRTIAGVSDTLLIAATPTNDNAKLFLDLAWFEIV